MLYQMGTYLSYIPELYLVLNINTIVSIEIILTTTVIWSTKSWNITKRETRQVWCVLEYHWLDLYYLTSSRLSTNGTWVQQISCCVHKETWTCTCTCTQPQVLTCSETILI